MATWYLDYEGGSDNNGGDSFAVTLTQADGVANGTTTFTSAAGGFTGLAGRKIYIPGKSVGRTISSVTDDNTVVLNATVTAGAALTFNVGGRRKDLNNLTTTNCQGLGSGDTVRMMGSPAPTSLSCVGTWQDCSPIITICGTTETLLSDCETAWTASANVTATADATIFKVGTKSAKIVIASGFTTGLAAYFATGTLDLSSKQILKFWLYLAAGALPTAGQLQLMLCTDAAGAGVVNAFNIPALTNRGNATAPFGSAYGQWHPIAIDLGSAMGASIQSIALYVASDLGAQTIYIDDVRVCNAPNLTKSISTCDSVWTALTNVTAATSSTRKEGSLSASLTISSSFTTGRAAYFATGTLDLSGYQQVSFWIQVTSGTLPSAGQMSLRLCSDTTGVTTVNTIAIPALTGGATSNWYCVTVDTGGNLGASIQSVALYIDSDVGAQTILLDNIFAAKASSSADAISLTSLIGKSDSIGAGGADTETFYAIRSIINNTINLDAGPNANGSSTFRGWTGTGQFETLYKQETTKTAMAATSALIQTPQNTGLLLEGGYDRTNMSSQTLQTWFDGGGVLGIGLNITTNTTSLNRIGAVRYQSGILISVTSGCVIIYSPGCNNCSQYGLRLNNVSTCTITNLLAANNCGTTNLLISSTNTVTIGTVGMVNNGQGIGLSLGTLALGSGPSTVITLIGSVSNNSSQGFSSVSSVTVQIAEITNASKNASEGVLVGNSGGNVTATIITASYNGAAGISIDTSDNNTIMVTDANNNVTRNISILGSGNRIYATNANNSSGFGVYVGSGYSMVTGLATTGNATAAISMAQVATALFCNNCTFAEATKVSFGGYNIKGRVYSFRDQQTTGAFSIFPQGGLITLDVTVNKTTGTASWKFSPTSSTVIATAPLEISLVKFTAVSGRTYTVQVYLRRSASTISAQIVCLKQQLQGIVADVTASNAAFVNNSTWEALSISVTPTETGPLEILARAWGGTTENCWFDDLTVNDGLTTVPVSLDYQSLTGPGLEPLVVGVSGGSGGSYAFCS